MFKPKAEGVPIGLLEDRQYEEVEFQTEIGDTILFYSDGMEDQLNAREEDYSRLRLHALLKKHGAEHPAAIAKAMFARSGRLSRRNAHHGRSIHRDHASDLSVDLDRALPLDSNRRVCGNACVRLLGRSDSREVSGL